MRKEQYKHNHFEGNQDIADLKLTVTVSHFLFRFCKLEWGNNT